MSGSNMTRRKSHDTSSNLPPHVVARHEEHSGFKKGDRCYIDGDQAGRYTFQHADEYDNGIVAAIVLDDRNLWYTPGIDRLLPASGPSRSSSEDGSETKLEPSAGDIAGRRKALKWSRSDLSGRCGVGVPAIATLEAGKNPRDKEARAKVLAALSMGEGGTPGLPPIVEAVLKQTYEDGPSPAEAAALGHDIFDDEEDEE